MLIIFMTIISNELVLGGSCCGCDSDSLPDPKGRKKTGSRVSTGRRRNVHTAPMNPLHSLKLDGHPDLKVVEHNGHSTDEDKMLSDGNEHNKQKANEIMENHRTHHTHPHLDEAENDARISEFKGTFGSSADEIKDGEVAMSNAEKPKHHPKDLLLVQ